MAAQRPGLTQALGLMFGLLLAIAISQPPGSDGYEPPVWSSNRDVLACSPRTVSADGILTLNLGKDHGDELAVRHVADNAWFFLVVGAPSQNEPQLMASDEFARAKRIHVRGDQEFRSAPGRLEKLFARPGKYEIYVSDVLESEVGGYRCGFTVK